MNSAAENRSIFLSVFALVLTLFLCPFSSSAQEIPDDLSFLYGYGFDQMPELATLTRKSSLVLLTDGLLPAWKVDGDSAREHLQQGNLADAETLYGKVLEAKDVMEVRWELANVLAATNRNQEALERVSVLVEEDTTRQDFLAALAALQLRVGKLDRAAQSYGLLAEVDPDSSFANAGTVFCLLSQKQSAKAYPFIKRLSDKHPDDFSLQQLYAQQAFLLGYTDLAEKKLSQLVKKPKANGLTFSLAARVAERLDRKTQAAGYWNQLLSFDAENIEALQWLATFYEKNGEVEKALPHFLLLHKIEPDNEQVVRKIGQCYVGMMEFAKALVYFEEYLARKPEDKEVSRFVVNIHAALGNKDETLAALEHYFEIESSPDQANLKKAAQLYDEHGLAQEAIGIYRRLLRLSPNDPKILTALASNFLELGKDEDALKIWRELARIAPGVVEVYKPIAALLEKLGRDDELLDVLEVIAELDPGDIPVHLRLAEMYLGRGAFERCGSVLGKLTESKLNVPIEFYRLRGRFMEHTTQFENALADFKTVLAGFPEDLTVRIAALNAAGMLGDLGETEKQYTMLFESAGGELTDEQLLKSAQAFMQAGSFEQARGLFQKLVSLEGAGQEYRLKKLGYLGLARCFRQENLFYEAESVLRQGLSETRDFDLFVPHLVELNLENGHLDAAEAWLSAVADSIEFSVWQRQFLAARLLLAKGERRKAKMQLLSLLATIDNERSFPAESGGDTSSELLGRLEAILPQLMEVGSALSVRELCEQILELSPASPEAIAGLQLTGGLDPETEKRLGLFHTQAARLIELSLIYEKLGRFELMGAAAEKAVARWPGSLKAMLLVARSLRLSGQVELAEEKFRLLAQDFPDHSLIQAELAAILLYRGSFDEVIERVKTFPGQAHRYTLTLLQARALWAKNQKKDSLQRYEAVVAGEDQPFQRFYGLREQFNVPLPEIDKQPSFLEKLFRSAVKNPEESLLDFVMTPSYLVSSLKTAETGFNYELSELYVQYCWQQQFSRELIVRNAIRKEEYFYAQKVYEDLIQLYPNDMVLLYELAGVYKRLGEFGREAIVYEKLTGHGTFIAGLDESISLNRLKQRPQLAFTTAHSREQGRDGYKNIAKDWQQLRVWYSPQTRRETTLDLSRINYRSESWDDVVRANRLALNYKATLFSGLTLGLLTGVERQDSGDTDTFMFGIEGVGSIGDAFVGSLSLKRDIVADTTASVRREIVRQELLAGVVFEPFYRLDLGGEYSLADFSDNNWTTGYGLWASYLLLSQPTYLQFIYKYDFKESNEGASQGGTVTSDGFSKDDHPYWSPKNYWSNQFGVLYKHEFGNDSIIRKVTKHYTVEYYLGHDSAGNGFQGAKGGFFVEITPELLLSAEGELVSSPVYRKKLYSLTASYSW
nr:tetratricopeptide repeat protein [Desulfobulbaceae bacterium]